MLAKDATRVRVLRGSGGGCGGAGTPRRRRRSRRWRRSDPRPQGTVTTPFLSSGCPSSLAAPPLPAGSALRAKPVQEAVQLGEFAGGEAGEGLSQAGRVDGLDLLEWVTAAALPLAGAAATAAVDAVDPKPGDVVLVAGATGGVGSYAIQLLAARGATVLATGTPPTPSGSPAWARPPSSTTPPPRSPTRSAPPAPTASTPSSTWSPTPPTTSRWPPCARAPRSPAQSAPPATRPSPRRPDRYQHHDGGPPAGQLPRIPRAP